MPSSSETPESSGIRILDWQRIRAKLLRNLLHSHFQRVPARLQIKGSHRCAPHGTDYRVDGKCYIPRIYRTTCRWTRHIDSARDRSMGATASLPLTPIKLRHCCGLSLIWSLWNAVTDMIYAIANPEGSYTISEARSTVVAR